jgi:hypothetical protein
MTKTRDEGTQLFSAPRGGNVGLGIDFSPGFGAHEGLINNRGEDVIHDVGMRCPCSAEDVHAGQIEQNQVPRRRSMIGCPLCRGEGYIFRRPQKICALITGISESKTRIEGGWAQPGDCMMSPHAGYMIASHDMITFLWPQPVGDGQVIVRGAGTASDNSQRETFLQTNEDRLWYSATEGIWCEGDDGVRYYPEGDFLLDGSKIIKWVGNRPQAGQSYVLKYAAYLEWIVFDPPATRRDRNRDLGSRVALRKRHVALVNNDPRPRVGDNIPFCARIQNC